MGIIGVSRTAEEQRGGVTTENSLLFQGSREEKGTKTNVGVSMVVARWRSQER